MSLDTPHPRVELSHLRYFVAVVEELHFRRAAERLGIAQHALSQSIRQLENELGVPLLVRTSRSVAPTDAGRVFGKEARSVLGSVERAIAETLRAADISDKLRIGCVPDVPIERLQSFLGALYALEPGAHADVLHLGSVEQLHRLEAGALDLGLIHDHRDHGGIETEPLFRGERLAAFLPTGHRLAAKPVLVPDDLAGETLVLFPRMSDPNLHDRLLATLEAAGYRFNEVLDTSGAHIRDLLVAVAEGHGIAIGPNSIFVTVGEASRLLTRHSLAPAPAMPPTVLASRANPPSRVAGAVDAAREVARDLHEWREDA